MRFDSSTPRLLGLAGALAALAIGAGCDTNQNRVFPGLIEGVPPVMDLGSIVPVEVTTRDALAESVIYGEVGPTGTTEDGGVTFNFEGTNGAVCVWIDPETVFWNQSVSPTNASPYYRVPDNPYDDGDLDVDVGQALYYTGTPGESVGTFEVRYEDSNGNVAPIQLSECFGPDPLFAGAQSIGKAGRASPEYCTINNTVAGVEYTVVMRTWSTPIDDDRLGFGMLLMQGSCASLLADSFGEGSSGGAPGPGSTSTMPAREYECVITGEAIEPGKPGGANAAAAGLPERTWLGSEVPFWARSVAFERAFCRREADNDGPGIIEFCREERQTVAANNEQCSWAFDASDPESDAVKCFCGDLDDTPEGGSF